VDDVPFGGGRKGSLVLVGIVLLVNLLSTPALSAANPFGPNHRVNDDLGLTVQKRVAAVADPSGNVYAAWQDARNGDPDIYFAISTDGGRTFGPSKRLGGERAVGTSQEKPAIALGSRGEIVVVWQDDRLTYMDYDIFGVVSYDRGTTFSPSVRIDDGEQGTLQLVPSVAVDSTGTVYVVWQDFRNGGGDLRLARGSVNPFSFGPSVRVDDDLAGAGTQASPTVVVSSLGTVYVAYHDNRTGDANVYLAKSTDGGRSFGPSVRIDDTGASATVQGLVSLAVDPLDVLYAVWQDAREGDFDIYFAKSTDGGRTFSRNVRVDDGPRGTLQLSPRVAIGAAGTVYAVWHDERNLDTDIYFTYSTDGGKTFRPSVRVDDAGESAGDPRPQYYPRVVESNTGLVTVLWEDGRTDDGDIYAATAYFPFGSALQVEVSLRPSWIAPGERTNVTMRVTSNGTGVDGAAISLSANASGFFGSVSSLGSGYYGATFTATFSMDASGGTVSVAIVASASKPGYVSGAGQAALKVSPRILVTVQAPWDTLAVGQSMDLVGSATVLGLPLANASVTATSSAGGSLSATGGVTDALGRWKTTFKALSGAGGTTVTVTIGVQKDGFIPASAVVAIAILAEPRPLEMQLTSNRWEMMSYETATVTVRLTSGGVGVSRALLSPYARAGNVSAAKELGNGTYTFTYGAPKVTGPTWFLLYVYARAGGYADAKGSLSLLVDPNKTNPSSPTQLYLYVYPASKSVPSGSSVLVTVVLFTVEGYAVSGATLAVSVFKGMGSVSAVTDRLNGYYTFSFTAASVQTETYATLRVGASKYGYADGWTRLTLLILP